MPDDTGAHLFMFEDQRVAQDYGETAHLLAFRLAALARQEGMDAVDAELSGVIASLLDGEPATPSVALLTLTMRRLIVFVRLLAGASEHPLAENLAKHPSLTDVQAEQMVTMLERLLRDGVL